MIRQLIRTNFESNLGFVYMFLIFNAFFFLTISIISNDHEQGSSLQTPEVYIVLSVWLLVICLLSAGVVLMRYNRDKRSRLFIQLPITCFQIRAAFWCQVFAALSISTLVLMILLNNIGFTASEILLFSLLYLFHAGSVVAILTLGINYTGSFISRAAKSRGFGYYFLILFLSLLAMTMFFLLINGYVYLAEGHMDKWMMLTLIMPVLCLTLVAVDIHLYKKMDNYLG